MNNKHCVKNQDKLFPSSKNRFVSPKWTGIGNSQKIKRQGEVTSLNKYKQTLNSDEKMCNVKIKRLITEQSFQQTRNSNKLKGSNQISKCISINKKSKLKKLYYKQIIKLQSDQQSTNIYQHNKQSADQQLDPYRIGQSRNKRVILKLKTVKPSSDFSVSQVGKQKLIARNDHRNASKQSVRSSVSVYRLKQQIKRSLSSFKSLTKYHEQQSQYFVGKVGVSDQEAKRLQKIHLVEATLLKDKIFLLRDQMDAKIHSMD